MKKINFLSNYKKRKIIIFLISLFIFISITLLVLQTVDYILRIPFEKEWALGGVFKSGITEAEKLKTIEKQLHSQNLLKFYSILMSILLALLMISFISLIVGQIKLYANKSNSNIELKISIFALSTALLFGFVFLSMQPIDVTRTIYSEELKFNITDILERISYTKGFVAYALILVSFILNLSAKKKFGFITNDVIINKEFKDTKFIEEEINAILNK
ncbi:hypothetical protein [Mycoplasma crocodyli]|uniref:Transmembrane protein n=1 Tax=Mycoplasma crocodyli (strain ATCC 51981 / MP145) TaxID=512564 RepID=D5E6C7_MYCCM|nr:hypothetical protein [Mycoplasma crocodyli]ADE19820.1 hypothetical protein MCRO_0721 [Mycoplasma crocodyli MP145]